MRLWSSVAKGRAPNMWQMEFTLQVTWWSNAILMIPAHTKAVRPPISEPDHSQPAPNGNASEATAHGVGLGLAG